MPEEIELSDGTIMVGTEITDGSIELWAPWGGYAGLNREDAQKLVNHLTKVFSL